MIHEVKMGKKAGKVYGGNSDVVRAFSDTRRNYADLTVDYEKEYTVSSRRVFCASVPCHFQFHVSEIAEIYVNRAVASVNDLHRILRLIALYELLELEVEIYMSDTWKICLELCDVDHKRMSIIVGLPKGCAIRVQSVEAGRCFVLGRDVNEGQIFMTDSMADVEKYGLYPF